MRSISSTRMALCCDGTEKKMNWECLLIRTTLRYNLASARDKWAAQDDNFLSFVTMHAKDPYISIKKWYKLVYFKTVNFKNMLKILFYEIRYAIEIPTETLDFSDRNSRSSKAHICFCWALNAHFWHKKRQWYAVKLFQFQSWTQLVATGERPDLNRSQSCLYRWQTKVFIWRNRPSCWLCVA